MRTTTSVRSFSVRVASADAADTIVREGFVSGELLAFCKGNEDRMQSLYVWTMEHPYNPERNTTVSTWLGTGLAHVRENDLRGMRASSRQRHMPGMVSSSLHADRDGAGASQATDRLYADHGKASYRENPLRNLLVKEVKRTVRKEFGLIGMVYLRTVAKGIRRDAIHGIGKEFQETLSRMGIVRDPRPGTDRAIHAVWVSGFRKEVAEKLAEVNG